MNARSTTLAILLVVASGTASRAESGEGHGNPFPFQAGHQLTAGNPFVSDTTQTVHPEMTGNTVQPSSLHTLEAAFGAEAIVHTANSLPPGATQGTVAFAQGKSLERARVPARVLEAGAPPHRL